MEHRLLPLNAFIALCQYGDLWPATLADVGYRLVGLEVPVPVRDGTGSVVIDALAFREEVNVNLAGEAKSGANVHEDQARRYAEMDPQNVVYASSVDVVMEEPALTVEPVYVCQAEYVDRISLGLERAGVDFPVVSFSDSELRREGSPFGDSDLEAAFGGPIPVPGPPPRYVAVDEESADSEFDDHVRAALVAELSHAKPVATISVLAERAIPHLALFGQRARKQLARKVEDSARRIAEADPDSFVFGPRTGTRSEAIVEFVRQPEEADRRGRTQIYQAVARAARPGRPRRAEIPGQTAFDHVLDELEAASDDTVEEELQRETTPEEDAR